jgi:surface antigen
MKTTLTLATLVLLASSMLPAQALMPNNNRTNTDSARQPSQDLILAQNNFDQYRQQRHAQLEQQMRQEVKKPQYNNLSEAQKAKIIRDSHNALDQSLDREYDTWKQQQSNNNGRYNNNDRYNNNNNRNDRNSQESFDQYRQRRHAELEQQMRQQVNQPQYRNLSEAQKAQMIRDAHSNLDQSLDREYDTWKQGNGNSSYDGRYNSGNNGHGDRYDRYNRNNQPYPQPNSNGGYNR